MMRNLLTGMTVTLLALIGAPLGGGDISVTVPPPGPSLLAALLNTPVDTPPVDPPVDPPPDTSSVDTPPPDTSSIDTPPVETPPPETSPVVTPSVPDTPPITIPSIITTPLSTDISTPTPPPTSTAVEPVTPVTSPTPAAPLTPVTQPTPAAPTPVTPLTPVTSPAPVAASGGTVHLSTVPGLSGVRLVVGGRFVTTGAGGTASVHVASLAGVGGSVRLASEAANGTLVTISRVVITASAPGTESLTVGLDVTSGVRLNVVPGTAGVSPASVHAVRLHSSTGQIKTVNPNVTSTVYLLSQRTSLRFGHLAARAVTWTVDSVSAAPGVAVTVPRGAFDPNRSSTWTLALKPVAGQVHVATVPATAGVHLTVAGVPVTTGSDGRVTVAVPNLDNMARQVHLANATAGADTVALTRVLSNPSPRRSRSITVGLNVTVPVRLSVAAGTSSVAPGTVRVVRLHSSGGSTVSVNPNAGSALPLLGVRTWLQHGRLVAERVTWTVDSISADPGVSVTTTRKPFEPATSTAWVLTLAPLAGSVSIQTVPATPGVHLSIAGVSLTTGADGAGSVTVADLNDVAHKVRLDDAAAGGNVVAIHRVGTKAANTTFARALVVALQVSRPVTLAFTDPSRDPVPANRIDSVTLRGDGGQVVLRGSELTSPVTLLSSIPSLVNGRWQVRPVIYSVAEVHLRGSNAVFAGRERFAPSNSGTWHISLALYTATIRVADALFGRSVGSTAHLTAQDGQTTDIAIPRSGVSLPSTVRGMYTLTLDAAVMGGSNRILVSGDTAADIRILTIADVAVLIGVVIILAIALLLVGAWVGRGNDRARGMAPPSPEPSAPRPRPWPSRSRPAWSHHAMSIVLAAMLGAGVLTSALAATPAASGATPPVAASTAAASPAYVYFYQWFKTSSWNRAKNDTPLVGRYSSANPAVLRTQLDQIKAAGITGILTSWKNTATLNNNLQMLIDQAAPEGIDLGVVYEALNFDRDPLPIDTVRADMLYLVEHWGSDLASRYFGAPVIIWTGTNEYTPAQVRSVHDALGGRALLLAASKNVADYNAVAKYVDGEAYYWSSANPTSPNTAKKLADMGAAVRAHGGVWIAPAAAGFDGRNLGHTRVIPRNEGQGLVQSLKVAYASDPTAVGVISWNEWSENTYIEPGQRYGSTELDALTDYLRTIHAGAAVGSPSQAGSAVPRAGDARGPASMTETSAVSPSNGTAGDTQGQAAPAGPVKTSGASQAGNAAAGAATAAVNRNGGFRWDLVGGIVIALALAGIIVRAGMRQKSRRKTTIR